MEVKLPNIICFLALFNLFMKFEYFLNIFYYIIILFLTGRSTYFFIFKVK